MANEPADRDETEHPPWIAASRPAVILLVDDEDVVRVATADMLTDIGYSVVQASSGAAALQLLREGASVELLVTDYLMPGMNGVELARHARALLPGLGVLVISGYSTIAEGVGADLPRLAKPFRQADLARRVAEILAGPASDTIKFPVERTRR